MFSKNMAVVIYNHPSQETQHTTKNLPACCTVCMLSAGVGTRRGGRGVLVRGVIISWMVFWMDTPPDSRHWAKPVMARVLTLLAQ